jgi:hypothetical protein
MANLGKVNRPSLGELGRLRLENAACSPDTGNDERADVSTVVLLDVAGGQGIEAELRDAVEEALCRCRRQSPPGTPCWIPSWPWPSSLLLLLIAARVKASSGGEAAGPSHERSAKERRPNNHDPPVPPRCSRKALGLRMLAVKSSTWRQAASSPSSAISADTTFSARRSAVPQSAESSPEAVCRPRPRCSPIRQIADNRTH